MKNIEEQAVKILYDIQYTEDVSKNCFMDILSFGKCVINVDKNGKQTHLSADPTRIFINTTNE